MTHLDDQECKGKSSHWNYLPKGCIKITMDGGYLSPRQTSGTDVCPTTLQGTITLSPFNSSIGGTC